MGVSYNVAGLFNYAFGIRDFFPFRVDTSESESGAINFTGVEVIENETEVLRLSYLGTPIVSPIIFKGREYQAYNHRGELEYRSLADFELPAATLATCTRAKVIGKTKAVAGNGSVKEIYAFDDWQIDIKGLCLADPSHSAAPTVQDQERKLLEFEALSDSISLKYAPFFTAKGISELVIENIAFTQLKGKPGVIPFAMKCRSNEPIELIL